MKKDMCVQTTLLYQKLIQHCKSTILQKFFLKRKKMMIITVLQCFNDFLTLLVKLKSVSQVTSKVNE